VSDHPIFNFLCSTDSDFDETWWELSYANIMNPQEISDDYLNSFMFFWSFNGDGGNRVFATRGRQIA
jgi:hypothetical protein